LIEQNARRVRCPQENLCQQSSFTPSDINDATEAGEIVSVCNRHIISVGDTCHRLVKSPLNIGMFLQVRKERQAMKGRER
jgi:hypothetical protein